MAKGPKKKSQINFKESGPQKDYRENKEKNARDKRAYEREKNNYINKKFEYDNPKYKDRFQNLMSSRPSPDNIKGNDIAWHNKSPLYGDATKIPFNVIPGFPVEPILNGERIYHDFQGVTVVDFIPSIGYADSMNSPVNRAFNALYSQIAQHTTGALQMQQMDLAFLTIGGSSLACALGWLKSIMGSALWYSKVNGYLPRYLTEAQDLDFDDLIENYNKYRIQINDLILRFNNLCIPDFSDVFRYHYSLAHNIYADEDSQLAQFFTFKPAGIYLFDDIETRLQWRPWNTMSVQSNLGSYISAITDSLEAWENTSVYPIVKGNLLRFYNDSEFFSIDLMDVNYTIEPHFDRTISYQINNMEIHNAVSLSVTQDPVGNILRFTPSWLIYDGSVADFVSRRNFVYLNSYDGDTSPEFIMEATRMIPCVNGSITEGEEGFYIPLKSVCNVIPIKARVCTLVRDAERGEIQLDSITITDSVGTYTYDSSATVADEDLLHLFFSFAKLSKYRNAPRMYARISSSDDPLLNDVVVSGDIYRATHLHQDQLDLLHLADMQSMYWLNVGSTVTR